MTENDVAPPVRCHECGEVVENPDKAWVEDANRTPRKRFYFCDKHIQWLEVGGVHGFNDDGSPQYSPPSVEDTTEFLARRKQQMQDEAAGFPPDAFEEALRVAHEREQTLIVERDHFRSEMWKTGRVLAVLVEEAGGELTIDVQRADELGDVMLDFAVSDDEQQLTVRLEDAPVASSEGSQPEGAT